MRLGGGIFESCLRYGTGALMKGMSALMKETLQNSINPSLMGRYIITLRQLNVNLSVTREKLLSCS